MRVVPKHKSAKVAFFQSKLEPWEAHAAEIGTSPEMVADLRAKVVAARDAYKEQWAAQSAAMAATTKFNNALVALEAIGASIISQIRGKARLDGEAVYALAQIPSPRKPSPADAPGKPTSFSATLHPNGTLDLTWKCHNPAGTVGTIYQVYRQTGSAAEFTYVGGTGSKHFIDDTIPPGTASVTYKVQAVRSTAVGEWGMFTMNFGVSPGSRLPTTGVQTRTMMTKAAA